MDPSIYDVENYLNPTGWSMRIYSRFDRPCRKPKEGDFGALRHWLRLHHRNPYPTKPEKIMLAILSRMTLTQVSTWFANARRRLRKQHYSGRVDLCFAGREKGEWLSCHVLM